MREIKFSDFKIIPDISSIRRENIDDATYFGDKYKSMVSNSRLKWINPSEGGNPEKFQNPPILKTDSLVLGSVVHQCTLESDKFYLLPKVDKPTEKLGRVFDEIDYIATHTKRDLSKLDEIIKEAALKVNYYSNNIDNKIQEIKDKYLDYIKRIKNAIEDNGKEPLILSNKAHDLATALLKSLKEDKYVQNLLFPVDDLLEPRSDVYCEDALFMDFIVIYKKTQCATIPFKLKIDNWNIDYEKKIVTLNDLKTTRKSTNKFMNPDGSFYLYHYARQLSVYRDILKLYCNRELGISEKNGWKFYANICAIETIPNYWAKIFYISEEDLLNGQQEYCELLKRIAGYEIFGYESELNFV